MFRWRPTSKPSASTAQWMQNDVPAVQRSALSSAVPKVEAPEVTYLSGDAASEVVAWARAGALDLV